VKNFTVENFALENFPLYGMLVLYWAVSHQRFAMCAAVQQLYKSLTA